MASIIDILKTKFTKEKISVGLDIGNQSIKIVKLRFFSGSVELVDFDLVQPQVDLEEAIRKIKQTQNLDSVNISFGGPSSVIRYINFPRMNSQELNRSLKFEAQKHIPFSLADVSLDGFILKDDLPDNKMLVVIAAIKKESLNQRLRLAQDAGLHVNMVDIDSLALINCFNFNYAEENNPKNKAVALLNIGASFSGLNILENGIPRLSRDIQIAGNSFTQKLADTLNTDLKAAEKQKLSSDKNNSDKIASCLESILGKLAGELRTSFDYYESQSSSSVSKIFLSGGGSGPAGLDALLSNLLGIESQYWYPFKEINLPASVNAQNLKSASPQLCVAVGLALRQ
jgi:type IV pilus assembly protein PilM